MTGEFESVQNVPGRGLKLREIHAEFRTVLAAAQTERDARPGFTPVTLNLRGYGPEQPAWLAFEVDMMHKAVNRIRASEGQPEVPAEPVWRAQTSAEGHVDYSFKFALYCAELAVYGTSKEAR